MNSYIAIRCPSALGGLELPVLNDTYMNRYTDTPYTHFAIYIAQYIDTCMHKRPCGVYLPPPPCTFATMLGVTAPFPPPCNSFPLVDRVAGLLEANGIYNVKLLVNRVRPDMIKTNDMMSVKDVQEMLGIPLLGAIPEDTQVCA